MIESHLGPDPHGLVAGYPQETQMEAIRHLLGIPWQELVRQGFIFGTNADFYELTEDGRTEIGKPISVYTPKRAIIEALAFLHKDLCSYEHYFRERKLKEAVAAAFGRVENRLNEVRDTPGLSTKVSASGVALPHKLYDAGALKFPYPKLAAADSQRRSAYEQALKNYLSSGIGWFRIHITTNLTTCRI